MKKFADYFEDAIAYGESLGLRNGTEERYSEFYVELDEPKPLKVKGKEPFYPSVLTVWEAIGIRVDSLDPFNPGFNVSQQIKLIKMFISGYEQYLADKKEPVAADSNK